MDFRTSKKTAHSPVHIKTDTVERAPSLRFLGVTITEDLSWADNTSAVVGKAQQGLYVVRRLRRANSEHPNKLHDQLVRQLHRSNAPVHHHSASVPNEPVCFCWE